MVCTGRVWYYGPVVIVIGFIISRLLLRVYVVVPASVAFIIVVVIVAIIFYRNLFLVGLIIIWIRIWDLLLQSVKNL